MLGKRIKRNAWLLLPFLITVGIWLAVYAAMGVFPFGGKQAFLWDGYDQIFPFLAQLQRMLRSGQDLFFSLRAALGMDTLGLHAYYTASPLNWLVAAFPEAMLGEAYAALMLLKFGLAASAFALFVKRALGARRTWAVLFAIPYALMGWASAYAGFVMWLDGMIWLPLICLGVYRLAHRKGGAILLTASLAILFLSNYYIGYMVALYAGLFFVYQMVQQETAPTGRAWGEGLLKMAGCGLLAAGMALWVIYPSYLFMAQNMDVVGGGLPALGWSGLTFADTFTGFFYEVLRDNFNGVKLFASVSSLLLVAAFFFCRDISRRKKLAAGALLLILFCGVLINWFNLFWHLMDEPTGFPYRQSFLISFTMLMLSAQALPKLVQRGKWPIASLVCAVLFAAELLRLRYSYPNYLAPGVIWRNIGFLAVWGVAITWRSRTRTKMMRTVATCAMIVLMVVEMYGHTLATMQWLPLPERSAYVQKYEELQAIEKDILQNSPGVYRFGDESALTPNDNLLFGYASMSHHSSTEDLDVLHWLQALGYPNRGWAYRVFYAQHVVTDALLGIAYSTPPAPDNGFYPITEVAGGAYQANGNALPLMFVLPRANGEEPLIVQAGSPFAAQQQALARLAPHAQVILQGRPQIEETVSSEGETTGMALTYPCPEDGLLYLALGGDTDCQGIYTLGGKPRRFAYVASNPQSVCVGQVREGDVLQIDLLGKKLPVPGDIVFASVDMQALTEVCSTIQSKTLDVHVPSTGILEGTVVVGEGEALCITIPYAEGFTLFIDGQQVAHSRELDIFIGAPVLPGTHEVRLEYSTPGLRQGLLVSAACAVIFAAVAVISWKRKKRAA